jgi:asparagine N-glycosylation enzyme membrane subunit Stt3
MIDKVFLDDILYLFNQIYFFNDVGLTNSDPYFHFRLITFSKNIIDKFIQFGLK